MLKTSVQWIKSKKKIYFCLQKYPQTMKGNNSAKVQKFIAKGKWDRNSFTTIQIAVGSHSHSYSYSRFKRLIYNNTLHDLAQIHETKTYWRPLAHLDLKGKALKSVWNKIKKLTNDAKMNCERHWKERKKEKDLCFQTKSLTGTREK